MRAARTDANQAAIVAALISAGCRVQSLAKVGDGCADLAVGTTDKRIVLLEVKDGAKSPSDRRLTPKQVVWHEHWDGWPVYVVTSVDEALSICAAGFQVKD